MGRRRRIGLAGVVVMALVAALFAVSQFNSSASTDRATVPAPSTSSTSIPSSVEAAPPTTIDHPSRSFTIAATGDFLIHMPIQRAALSNGGGSGYDFSPMLGEISGIISAADLAICHLETPVSPDNSNLSGYPIFNAPHEIVSDAAAAGFDACDTASNHTLDKGSAGVDATLDALEAAGLGHAGSYRTEEERRTPNIYDVNGIAVGHLAYAYGTNGVPMPPGQPWAVALIDEATMLADAAALRAAGADVVIMSIHWGIEYQQAPSPDQRSLAEALLASPDVDLIIGDHVHVVQPIEKINDKYVAYGVGNFLSNQGAPATPTASQDGMILQVRMDEQLDGRFLATNVSFTPTWVNRSNYHVTLATPTGNPASYERTVGAVTSLGPDAYDGEAIFDPLG